MTTGIGLIGTGIFARNRHAPAISAVADLKLVACANRTLEKALKFASETANIESTKVYTTLDELLADPAVDAIDALLPVQSNLETLKKVIAANKPISLEKPIAATLDQAREIVKLASQTDLPVAILENFAHFPVLDDIKNLLSEIGSVIYFSHYCTAPFNVSSEYLKTSWRLHPEHIGGYLSDGGVHQIALFTEILGEVESLSALTTQVREESGTVDSMTSTLRMKSGVMGTFTYTSAVSNPRINRMIIHGTEGSIIFDFSVRSSPTLTLFTNALPAGKPITIANPDTDGIVAEFTNFSEAVQSHDKSLLKVTPEKAFHHFAVICAAVESGAKNGETVAIPQP
ncbi:uncharacterized protein V1516DRAFT_668037 [Lipomyces oligophaga]|uniref:uncharacterized protein n=1 Tax=Lipomyces oligophaga TaxID=45792 RepID=UPI0034CF381C